MRLPEGFASALVDAVADSGHCFNDFVGHALAAQIGRPYQDDPQPATQPSSQATVTTLPATEDRNTQQALPIGA